MTAFLVGCPRAISFISAKSHQVLNRKQRLRRELTPSPAKLSGTKRGELEILAKTVMIVESNDQAHCLHLVKMHAVLIGYFATATGAFLSLLLVYYCLVYPYWLSPLAKIPNAHWTSPSVSWWILWKRYRQQELPAAWEAHQRLGPIVRLGPKDLSVSCYNGGIRTIYGGGFDKPAYFDVFNNYGLELTDELIIRVEANNIGQETEHFL